jgi:hypothetical protein
VCVSHFRQFAQSFTSQWLPFFVPHGKTTQHTFGFWTFSNSQNMSRDDLTSPVAAAATSQVKLCPYDEEEPHIWFRLIEAQFAAAGIKSQKLKYANSLANLPKQVLRCFHIP